jgi:hypothetical protein
VPPRTTTRSRFQVLTSLLQAAAAAAALSATPDAPPPRVAGADTVLAGPDAGAAAPTVDPRLLVPTATDTVPRRPHAVEYSDWYGRRLTIHRWASYTMLPIFAGEYVYGQRLLHQKEDAFAGRGSGISESDRGVHQFFAGAVATLFGINTVTGAWNLYDARRDPAGRTIRLAHSALLLASDAGFVATGLIAGRATSNGPADARTHRDVALASMGVATVGTGMMWLFHH